MKVYKALCIKDWHIEAENGDRQDCHRGKTYTISDPWKDGTVTVFSGFWVRAPAHIFERRHASRGLAGASPHIKATTGETMIPFGMPGPGGSLGECALCGKPFIAEILLGKNVKSFTIPGCGHDLYGHDDCLKKFQGKEFNDLPPESALRKAWERAKNITQRLPQEKP